MKYGQNGEATRVGKRRLIVNYDEVEIVSYGPWRVVECTKYAKDGWKSIKVYLDRPARKNVWRLGFKGSYASRSHDGGLFTAYYPDVYEWVKGVVSGEGAAFPEDDSEQVEGIFPVSERVRSVILKTVEARQDHEYPWSNAPQTKKLRRYIIPGLAKELNINPKKAKLFLDAMIRSGEIEVFIVNTNTRVKGLRVVNKMEIDNG